MKQISSAFLAMLVVLFPAHTATAEENVVELSRSAANVITDPGPISVNPTDGSCWVIDSGVYDDVGRQFHDTQIVRLSAAGALLWRSAPGQFLDPLSVSVSPKDGSCWVSDGDLGVIQLSATGQELWQSSSADAYRPFDLTVDPNDGSCWFINTDGLVHLSSTGAEIWRSYAGQFSALSLNTTDGSCWVADYDHGQIVHLSPTGAELSRSASGQFSSPQSISVNPTNGSCWIVDYGHKQVVHLSSAGVELWRSASGRFSGPEFASVSPLDGSCWVVDSEIYDPSAQTYGMSVARLSESGQELASLNVQFERPLVISVDPTDSSCWVADQGRYDSSTQTYASAVLHLSATGEQLSRSAPGAFCDPRFISVNPSDGSCWVADNSQNQMVHLSKLGAELCRSDNGVCNGPLSIFASPVDGSCSLAQYVNNMYTSAMGLPGVVRVSAAGDTLWSSPSYPVFSKPQSLSGNRSDESVWVADADLGCVVHLSSAGQELWRSAPGTFTYPWSVSVNPSAGSCWVADTLSVDPNTGMASGQPKVVHVSSEGTVLWQSPAADFSSPHAVAVNPSDGSCWVADWGDYYANYGFYSGGTVVHISSAGTELWRSLPGDLGGVFSLSVNSSDGSCWTLNDLEIVHVSSGGQALFRNGNWYRGSHSVSVNSKDGSCWLAGQKYNAATQGYDDCVVHLASNGAELWHSADGAFYDPQSVSVDPSDGSCWVADYGHSQVVHLGIVSFDDVSPDHWAYRYIEAIYQATITLGCEGGRYCPEATVTRGQMALFLARSIGGLDSYTPPTTSQFADVPTDYGTPGTSPSAAYKAIAYIADAAHNFIGRAITLGCTDSSHYCPETTVTRGQMALFLARSIGGTTGGFTTYTPPTTSQFADVPTDSVAFAAVEFIADAAHNPVGRAVTLGCDATHYCPDRTVTRDQMAVFLARAFLGMN